MRTYVFKVVIEPDELPSGEPAWHIYAPALYHLGAASWGATKEEAIKSIHEVIQIILEELTEDGTAIPEERDVEAIQESLLAVSV